jgi:hypothetical protein
MFAPDAPDEADEGEADDISETDVTPAARLAQAEARLQQAQAQLSSMASTVPPLEQSLAAAKRHLLATVAAAEAVRVAVASRGLLRPDDPVVSETETAVKQAHRAFEEATWQLQQAQAQHARGQQAVTEAAQQLALVQRDVYVQREAPDLWRRIRQALVAYAEDPCLRNPMGYANSDVQRARWTHDQRLSGLEGELAALLKPAVAQGLVPADPRPLPQRKLVTRSRTWL